MAVRAIGEIAQFFGDKPNNDYYDNGVWQGVLDIPYIERIEEAGLYKVIIRTLWLSATGWSKEIRNRYPQVIQIGLNDHPLSTHISKLGAEQQLAYVHDLEYLDGIMALTEEERQWYQVVCPSKPVIKAGLPFPVEAYEERYGHLRASEKKYIGLGVGASDNDRNFGSALFAFKRLQIEYPDIVGVFLSIPDKLIPYTATLADDAENVFIHQRTDMDDYMDALSQCKFVINLADRNTPGRLQGEAAFLEIPVIGSNRLELQNELFPSLATSPYELENVVWLAKGLLDGTLDPEIGKYAHAMLIGNYNYEVSRDKFNKLLATIKG